MATEAKGFGLLAQQFAAEGLRAIAAPVDLVDTDPEMWGLLRQLHQFRDGADHPGFLARQVARVRALLQDGHAGEAQAAAADALRTREAACGRLRLAATDEQALLAECLAAVLGQLTHGAAVHV